MCMKKMQAVFNRITGERKKPLTGPTPNTGLVTRRLSPRQIFRMTWRRLAIAPTLFSMPAYQPCPKCRGWKKRNRIELPRQDFSGGAWYWCNRDKEEFFVGARSPFRA